MRRTVLPSEVSLLRGLAVARWASWAWTVGVVALTRSQLDRAWAAWVMVVVIAIANSAASLALRSRPDWLVQPTTVMIECGLGIALLAVDGIAYRHNHVFNTGQNLAAAWPLVAVLSAGVASGPAWGGFAAIVVAAGRVFGARANGVDSVDVSELASLAGTAVFYALAGAVAGWVALLLRRVETEVVATRAREEVARTLHDGVLQTLALVERRSAGTDPELAAVARASDRELRNWLYHGPRPAGEDGLTDRLTEIGHRVATMHDVVVDVNVVDGGIPVAPRVVEAVAGAVHEAVVNAAKHAGPQRIVVFAEVDDDGTVFASVRDDGCGFDPARTVSGRGIDRSIRARLADAGGTVEIDSAVGAGTEVRIWVPKVR